MSSFNLFYLNDINRLQAVDRGVEANVEATLTQFRSMEGCHAKHFLFIQMCTQELAEIDHRRRFGAPSKRHVGKARRGL